MARKSILQPASQDYVLKDKTVPFESCLYWRLLTIR